MANMTSTERYMMEVGKANLHKLPATDLDLDFGNRLPPQYVSRYGRKSNFHKENLSALDKSIEELSAICTP